MMNVEKDNEFWFNSGRVNFAEQYPHFAKNIEKYRTDIANMWAKAAENKIKRDNPNGLD